MMLLKGGARFASQPQAMSCRVVRDLDILFPADRLVDAIELLIESRLRSVNGRLPGVIKSLPFTPLRPAGPRPADFMEIDVHAAPLRLGQNGDFDAAVWRRAVPAALLGVPVFVPSASDRFLQAVAHGLVADDDRPFDWVVDALVALRHPDFDADVAASEIRGRCLGVPLAMGCSVIEDRLGVAVPREILLACKPQIGSLLFRAEMEATLSVSRKRSLVQRTVIGAAEWVRSSGAARRAATWNTAWLFKPSLRHSVDGASTFALGRATVPLASGARVRQGRLIVYLTLPDEMLMRRSFDLLIDDVWIGRVRLRATGALKRLPHRSWRAIVRYRLPRAFVGPGPSVLTVVSLDDRKFPSDQPLEGVAVTASIGRLRV